MSVNIKNEFNVQEIHKLFNNLKSVKGKRLIDSVILEDEHVFIRFVHVKFKAFLVKLHASIFYSAKELNNFINQNCILSMQSIILTGRTYVEMKIPKKLIVEFSILYDNYTQIMEIKTRNKLSNHIL